MKIGFGYDVHKLVEGRPLILGGVKIPFEKGLLGHSDADVLTHAIIDAMLGAAGEGDIGKHFPSDDPKYKGISSLELLKKIKALIDAKGYNIGNIDSTVVIQEPRLAPFIDNIVITLSRTLNVDPHLINVKAKTEEGLGFTGEGMGVSAHAVCLLHRKP
jgi:2-C-methyl-D-erythritol 2,4-cyclodiphosphate synthase